MIHISKSEWRIMRVLWETPYLTSGEITSKISETKPISVSTVKTQIQNLLNKGVIASNHENRFPVYYSLMTEYECIKCAVDEMVSQFYGDSLNYESAHFKYYGVNDSRFISLLETESNMLFERAKEFFEVDIEQKVKVYIHASQKKLFSVYGKTDGPNWVKTTDIWDIIHLAPLEVFNGENVFPYFSYSLFQIFMSNINNALPYYLKQGICVYLGQHKSFDSIREKVKDIYLDFSFETLLFMHVGSDTFGEMNHMEVMVTFIEYIIHDFGKKVLKELVYGERNFILFINEHRDHIVEDWKKFIERKYIVEGKK